MNQALKSGLNRIIFRLIAVAVLVPVFSSYEFCWLKSYFDHCDTGLMTFLLINADYGSILKTVQSKFKIQKSSHTSLTNHTPNSTFLAVFFILNLIFIAWNLWLQFWVWARLIRSAVHNENGLEFSLLNHSHQQIKCFFFFLVYFSNEGNHWKQKQILIISSRFYCRRKTVAFNTMFIRKSKEVRDFYQ